MWTITELQRAKWDWLAGYDFFVEQKISGYCRGEQNTGIWKMEV